MDRQQLVEEFFTGTIALKRMWRAQFHDRLGDVKLSFGQMIILKLLHEEQSLSSKQIAELTHSSKSSVAQLLDGLDQEGFITRKPDDSDRRIVHISLSSSGIEKLEVVHQKRKEFFSTITEDLDEEDLRALNRIQAKILQGYKDRNRQKDDV